MLRSTLMKIRTESAALAVALVDAETGLCIEHDALAAHDVEDALAASAAKHSRLWRIARAHRSGLRLRGPIECIVVTEATVVHVLRPIDPRSSLVLYAVVARGSEPLDGLLAALDGLAARIGQRWAGEDAMQREAHARTA